MLIKCLEVGNLETNCYIISDEGSRSCAIIDPGDETGTILNYLEETGLRCVSIFLTHGHYDHTLAAPALSEESGAPIYICERDCSAEEPSPYFFVPDGRTRFYSEGDALTVGSLVFRVLETPGHSPGSVTLACEDALFVGDTLFRGSCGRVDLPGGDMKILLRSLYRLGKLYEDMENDEGDLEVYPGHAGATTMSREIRFNQYMRLALGR